jgi:hypothetical protein
MIEGLRLASTNSTHSKCQKRRPALKKKTTNSVRPKPRQTASTKTTTKLTVGVDLGDQNSAYCVLDAKGDVLSEGTVRTPEGGFEHIPNRIRNVLPDPPAKALARSAGQPSLVIAATVLSCCETDLLAFWVTFLNDPSSDRFGYLVK